MPAPPYHERWIGRDGRGRLNRDCDLILPEPPVVTSNAGIPESKGAMQTRIGIVQKKQSVLRGESKLKPRRDGRSAVSGL